MCFSAPSAPPPPPPPPPPKPAPTKVDPAVRNARTSEQRQAAMARGQAGTIKTTAQGVLNPARTTDTLI